MVTDGADTSDASLDESLASLKARSIPVFTVGVGQERFDRDIQITRVETPRSTLKGTSLSVDVVISQTGYAGPTVPLHVEDDGRIVSSQEVTLPRRRRFDDRPRATFNDSEAGPRLFRFRSRRRQASRSRRTTSRDALVEVTDRREKVLYLEGEPRFEVKFIRRAVEDDENLQVVILQRTAEDKYSAARRRQSRRSWSAAFRRRARSCSPTARIILGSVEAASFSPDQLRMLADFVSKRGGGLLMLGGRRSFAEGGWAGTPVARSPAGGARRRIPRGAATQRTSWFT